MCRLADVEDMMATDNEEQAAAEEADGATMGGRRTLDWWRARRNKPLWRVGEEKSIMTVQQLVYALCKEKRDGKIRNNVFDRCLVLPPLPFNPATSASSLHITHALPSQTLMTERS